MNNLKNLQKESLKKSDSGQILIIVFISLAVVLFSVLAIVTGAQIYFSNALYSANSTMATNLAEAGVDKALASLNKTGGSYNGEGETSLGEGSYSVTIATKDAATKVIEATGYVPNKANPKSTRTIKITASKGVGVAFVYGVQVGEGGLELGKENEVQGSIYSNGNIVAGRDNNITGDVWVAGGPAGSADQQTDCDGSNCQDYLFGKTVNSEIRLDIAQSFKPSISAPLNKVSLKIKKIGSPADVTVRIMKDNDGKPDKNNILTTGTLYSSLVTTSYGWIDVAFNSSPNLNADTAYWIMVDTSSNTTNYWSWQEDLARSYTRGQPKWSPNWNVGSPDWTSFNADLSFKLILGGGITSVTAEANFTVGGNVHANTIVNATIAKDVYFQTITNTTATNYYPGSADPPPKVFPISDANIADWKQQAEAAGITAGNITDCVATLGPGKIVGTLNLEDGKRCTTTVKTPIWVTGDFKTHNHNTFRLSPDYGSSSGVIIVDGLVDMDNHNTFEGTGIGNSLLMVLSTFDSRTSGISAMTIRKDGNSGVFYAGIGTIEPGNKNNFKELTAWKIKILDKSTINYETGLSSTLFSSGPSGSYSLVKGTYQVK